jgi:hypothetical protein
MLTEQTFTARSLVRFYVQKSLVSVEHSSSRKGQINIKKRSDQFTIYSSKTLGFALEDY